MAYPSELRYSVAGYDSIFGGPVLATPVAQPPPLPIHNQPLPQRNYVSSQIANDRWIRQPQAMPRDCPPGLEYLADVSQIDIEEAKGSDNPGSWASSVYSSLHQYTVKTFGDKLVYLVTTDFNENASRDCYTCELRDGFTRLHFIAKTGQEVVNISPMGNCFNVQSPVIHEVLATVFHEANKDKYHSIRDNAGHTRLMIKENFNMFTTNDFFINTSTGQYIGMIVREKAGFFDCFSNEFCRVTFPKNLQIKLKAAVICKAFHINFTKFYSARRHDEDSL